MRFVTGHATGMTGADLMSRFSCFLYFRSYTSMPMTDRIRMTFITRRNALKRNPMIVPDKRNRTIRYTGMIPLL